LGAPVAGFGARCAIASAAMMNKTVVLMVPPLRKDFPVNKKSGFISVVSPVRD
jgi:hypothetical protein